MEVIQKWCPKYPCRQNHTACGPSGSCLVPLFSLSRFKEQHIQARSHMPLLALSSDNAHNTSNSKTKLPFVTTWEAQPPKIKFVLQKRHTGICQLGSFRKIFSCIVTRLPSHQVPAKGDPLGSTTQHGFSPSPLSGPLLEHSWHCSRSTYSTDREGVGTSPGTASELETAGDQ